MTKKESKRTPLAAFLHHQGKAVEETGKAVISLLPKGFRSHLGNAIDEGRAGWGALIDGVVDTVQDGLDKVRSEPKAKESGDEKVKVEVE